MDSTTTTTNAEVATRRPLDTAARQQRMVAWSPILHPVWVIGALFVLGGSFIPIGIKLKQISNHIVEHIARYDSYKDGDWSACGLDGLQDANKGKVCNITFTIDRDMEAPVLVHYEIENFHQNYRAYSKSRDDSQLLGSLKQTALQRLECQPLTKLGNLTLNPCGLIANTFFNDIFEFKPTDEQTQANLEMIEDGISWQSDGEYMFRQPHGFKYEECSDCDDCDCSGDDWSCEEKWTDPKTGTCYRYFYPNDDTTHYLYETYPMISPIKGVTDEHFIVWMRIAAFPHFRKLYGYFDTDIKAGQTLEFQVTANWDVKSFKGGKSLVLSTTSAFGGKNLQFGNCFIGLGGFFIIFAIFFSIKHIFKPRKIADPKYLKYKVE